MKCALCKEAIPETFLAKIKGTYIVKGKKKEPVCFRCQKQRSMEEMKAQLNL